MTIATLRALQTTIASAIDEIEAVYASQTKATGLPLDFPSLDVPYYPGVPHAPEADKAEELRLDPAVFAATNRIVGACGQITATVRKPYFSLTDSTIIVRTLLSLSECLGGVGLMMGCVGLAVGNDRVHQLRGSGSHSGYIA